ncbi:hypothetical protein GF108_17745 [Phyllobacterium sp. SYP-B3895]|uniref:hypothetical protein n=1 Tax=Phyllobacterium sp. SYP-B3895 TaxID=2663240 RepID=UPI0012995B1F|nr:hypothetical protein [Phyllobacterium sp. SYP-B3895]MRG57416.1 hypothetical protein [Phyllobacterium sp. SYP-B3895]
MNPLLLDEIADFSGNVKGATIVSDKIDRLDHCYFGLAFKLNSLDIEVNDSEVYGTSAWLIRTDEVLSVDIQRILYNMLRSDLNVVRLGRAL